MRNFITNHPRLSALIGGAIVLLIILVAFSWGAPAKTTPGPDPSATTKITSPFAQVTVDTAINSDLQATPNDAATTSQYEFFGIGLLPLSSAMSYRIHEDLPSFLARDVIPTYPHTYIHIDRSTIKCNTGYDCSFSFYLDSPERYYFYHNYLDPKGNEVISMQQRPLPEAPH